MAVKKDKETIELSLTLPLSPTSLSKSLFVSGHQCHKLLWWKVNEPNAEELQPSLVLQDRFDQGKQVDALAREHFAAVEGVRFQATYEANGIRVRSDVLLPDGDGWRLIEVKASNSVKDEHVVDCAVQLHVLEANGVRITGVDVMHLYKECAHPDLSNLLIREDVTEQVRALLPTIPSQVEQMLAMLGGPLPEKQIGLHCSEPFECPFQERCWPKDEDHISRLYKVGRKKVCADYMTAGVHRIGDIPPKKKLSDVAKRQIRAMKENRTIVEDGLADALAPFNARIGFLDFETIQRAVPVWPGMGPWDQEPAQFSYHEFDYSRSALTPEDESRGHVEFLAEGAEDCRPALAERMIAATRNAKHVVSFSAFEKTRIRGLQDSVPDLRNELVELEHKLIDLLPVLRDHVYHPGFRGSFSLKVVLPTMVPELTYDDLVIFDGMVASVEIARLLFVTGKVSCEERERVRSDLLAYCRRDTWAMVKLLEQLRGLSRAPLGNSI